MDFKTKDNFSVTFHYQQGFETDKSDPGLNIHTLGNTKNTLNAAYIRSIYIKYIDVVIHLN